MSARDPQQMSYPQVYPQDFPKCTCGHDRLVHVISETTKQRTACSVMHGGKCRCKQYVDEGDTQR